MEMAYYCYERNSAIHTKKIVSEHIKDILSLMPFDFLAEGDPLRTQSNPGSHFILSKANCNILTCNLLACTSPNIHLTE